jgi:hypothetical protein
MSVPNRRQFIASALTFPLLSGVLPTPKPEPIFKRIEFVVNGSVVIGTAEATVVRNATVIDSKGRPVDERELIGRQPLPDGSEVFVYWFRA